MSVVKPSSDVDPVPRSSHWLSGVPGSWFSVTMAFCANAPFSAVARKKIAANKILIVASLCALARHFRRPDFDRRLYREFWRELVEVDALRRLGCRFDDGRQLARRNT